MRAGRAAVLTPGAWVRNELWRRARAVPSLDLRFAESKSLRDAVTGQLLVTHTRASSGTETGSDGLIRTVSTDVPRFDHNPLTGECLGLLMEEQRTNLYTYSQSLATTPWTTFNATVTDNATTSPDGTTNAASLLENATNNPHFIYWNTTTSATPATVSFYVKQNGRQYAAIRLRAAINDWVTAVYDLTGTGLVANTLTGTSSTYTGVSSTIASLRDGWYRISVSATRTGGISVAFLSPSLSANPTVDANGSIVYAGDVTKGLFAWGAQLEAGSFATSYIPTTTATVTRSADVADVLSAAVANGIRALYLEFRNPASGTRGVVSLNDNSANQRSAVNTSGTDPLLVVVDGGVSQANVDGGTITANARTRVAVRINANDFSISVNGGATVTDTSGTVPTVDRLMLGRTQAGEYLNGPLARVIGWRETLPDHILQELTR